jgi:hypothetical protein
MGKKVGKSDTSSFKDEYIQEGETKAQETDEKALPKAAYIGDQNREKAKKFAENLKNKKTPNRRR